MATQRRPRRAQRTLIGGVLVAPLPTHGTASGYRNDGCRCAACTAAHRRATHETRTSLRRRTAENNGVAPTRQHNHSTYTNWGCRCRACTLEHRDYQHKRAVTSP